jgi:hypothetical protein
MRTELAKLDGQRLRFSGTIERFGSKRGWKGSTLKTVLLRHVRRYDKGLVVTDHLWFTAGRAWEAKGMEPGATVAFDARVGIYEKGYKGHREDVFVTEGIDYRLERPTRVMIVQERT